MQLWQLQKRKVLLASTSPRRKELLGKMGVEFEVVKSEPIDEVTYLDATDICGSVARLAVAKAQSVTTQYPQALVLSADTVVVVDGCFLGKPADRTAAYDMLHKLSGRKHTVLTGVALTCTAVSFCSVRTVSTEVYFRNLSVDEIEWYLASGEAYDKAGGYGIQGKAMNFVDKIEGCFYNVVGLPIQGTIDLFKEFDAKGTP
jgi:septum formation protein